MAHQAEDRFSSQEHECSENRHSAYKKLVAELSEHLVPEDLKQIIFLRSLPESLKKSAALDVLDYMDKRGDFSPTNIQSLTEVLKDVRRNDLVNEYVEEYQRKFGRHSSMPASTSPRLALNRRANTCPTDMTQPAHAVVPSACHPVQETGVSTHGFYRPAMDTQIHSQGREAAATQPQPASLTVKARVKQLEGNPSSYTNHSSEEPTQRVSHPPEATMHQSSSYDQAQSVERQSESQQRHVRSPQEGSTRARHLSEQMSHSGPITPVHFRQTSTPLPPIHQYLPSHPHAAEYESPTPASLSASSSAYEMHSIHNHAAFDQESRHTSSPSSTNVSQDLLTEPRGAMGVHHLGRQHLDHNSQLNDTHNGQREAFPPHLYEHWNHGYNSSQEILMPDLRIRVETGHQLLPASLPMSYRRTSYPETTLRSTQTERLPLQPHSASFSHSPYLHKKPSAPASNAASDSGVEMVRHQPGPGSVASESIEPWMSISNDKEQFEGWMQPQPDPPHTRSVSTGVQTDYEEASEKTLTPATLSPVASVCDESEDSNEGQDTAKPTAVKKSRPLSAKLKFRPKLQQSIRWVLKRNKLNEAIYKHKQNKRITCPNKLELDAGCGGANPRLVFHLVPCGLENDSGKNATLEIEIEVPKRCTRFHSETKVKISISVRELKEDKLLAKHGGVEKSMSLRQFLIPRFVTHGDLKDSHCDQIEIRASAELIMYSKLTRSPTN